MPEHSRTSVEAQLIAHSPKMITGWPPTFRTLFISALRCQQMLATGRLDYVIMVVVQNQTLQKPDPLREIYVHRGDRPLLPQLPMVNPWYNTFEESAKNGVQIQALALNLIPGMTIVPVLPIVPPCIPAIC